MPETATLRLSVYDVQGRLVREMVDRAVPPGWYDVSFDASDLPSGLYVYRLEADMKVESRSMLLVK
jgi:hypothetical protein